MKNNYYPFVNQPLPYEYSALEPFIDEKTMQIHHQRHLQTYINNLNQALKGHPRLQKLSLEQLIRGASKLPEELQTAVRNNAGGVYNHRFYFKGLQKPTKYQLGEVFDCAIRCEFGSYEDFIAAFKKAALGVFGSGYTWLVLDRGKLCIINTANQNSPIEQKLCPILCLDLWEHAYYLKHYNVRGDYIDDWFKIVNWNLMEQNYLECLKKR